MGRAGSRLKLMKQQVEAGDIRLLFADESEALTYPCLARAWARRGADLRIPAPQGNRVWKFKPFADEHSMNFLALSLRLWSGFDVLQPRCGRTNPNAIALPRAGAGKKDRHDGGLDFATNELVVTTSHTRRS